MLIYEELLGLSEYFATSIFTFIESFLPSTVNALFFDNSFMPVFTYVDLINFSVIPMPDLTSILSQPYCTKTPSNFNSVFN